MSRFVFVVLWVGITVPSSRADDQAEGVAFFEQRIRPVLVEHCYECHSAKAKSVKAGLRLDTRALSLKGGDSGAAVVPKDVEKGWLIRALRQEDFEMPSGRLPDEVIRDFERWVRIGAPDPREDASSVASEFNLQERVEEHWCWRPVKRPNIPADTPQPIDYFIGRELTRNDLSAAPVATSSALASR